MGPLIVALVLFSVGCAAALPRIDKLRPHLGMIALIAAPLLLAEPVLCYLALDGLKTANSCAYHMPEWAPRATLASGYLTLLCVSFAFTSLWHRVRFIWIALPLVVIALGEHVLLLGAISLTGLKDC
jgi:hypothetical protein